MADEQNIPLSVLRSYSPHPDKLDLTGLTQEEITHGIKSSNLPDYIRYKQYLTDTNEAVAQLAEMIIQFAVNLGLDPDQTLDWARKLQQALPQSEFDSWVATLLDGGPSIFMNTLSELQTTYPNGAAGVALVRETDPAKIYVWNGTSWEDFGDYQGLELKDESVTPAKTTFINDGSSKNLINPDEILIGGYYQAYGDGSWIEDFNYVTSGKIPVRGGMHYSVNPLAEVFAYDDSGNFVAEIGREGGLAISEASAASYVQIRMLSSNLGITTFEENDPDKITKPYRPTYTPYIGSPTYNLVSKRLGLGSIDGIDIIKHENLLNPADFEHNGYYQVYGDGSWIDNEDYFMSGKVPVQAGMSYFTNNSAVIYAFDKDDKLINEFTSGNGIGETSSAAYFRVRGEMSNVDSQTLVAYVSSFKEKSYIPPYTPYVESDTAIFNDVWTNGIKRVVEYTPENIAQNKPRKLYLPDFSGYDEPFHPSAIYIKDGFAGYKYWLVQSPYPIQSLITSGVEKYRWEVPIVYKSNDGFNWLVVANPLDDLTSSEVANEDYMSDPHILYNEDLKRLEVFYRLTHRVGDTLPTTVFRKTTTDGETWTEREIVIPEDLHTSSTFARSPSFVYHNGVYKMWKQNNYGLWYQDSVDGINWSEQEKINLSAGGSGWHIDVNIYDDGKHMYHLVRYQTGIVYFYSDDGINFTHDKTIMQPLDGNPLYSGGMYRSVSLMDENNNIRVYWSGIQEGGTHTNVGVLVGKTWDTIVHDTQSNVKGVENQNLQLEMGALGIEVAKSKYKVDDFTR